MPHRARILAALAIAACTALAQAPAASADTCAGADLEAAVLGQSLVSDSIDKVITYFVVYVILGTLAVRTKVRFPQGDRLLPLAPAGGPPTGRAGSGAEEST